MCPPAGRRRPKPNRDDEDNAGRRMLVAQPGRAESDEIRVLFIAGVGRSGSTLLNRMLGQLPGHVGVGELTDHIWDYGLKSNWLCACGESTSTCEFWAAVGLEAFGGWQSVDTGDVIALKHSVDRTHYIPLLLAPWLVPSFRRRLARYTALLSGLYKGIADVSGARVIVDSCHRASTLYSLRHARKIDLRVVLLVRDPRGVAYSYSKADLNSFPEGSRRVVYMPTWLPHTAGRRWLTQNALVAILGWLGIPVTLVRYEDLISAPMRELQHIATLLGETLPPDGVPFLHKLEVELLPAHVLSGNPNRFHNGRVALRPDEAWRNNLPPAHRRLVEALTWPLRSRYGYRRQELLTPST